MTMMTKITIATMDGDGFPSLISTGGNISGDERTLQSARHALIDCPQPLER